MTATTRHLKQLIVFVLILGTMLMVSFLSRAASLPLSLVIQNADTLKATPFEYAYVIPYGHVPEPLTDSLFYKSAKGVIFPVNKYNLNLQDPWLRELNDAVSPWASQNGLRLRYVEMRGASSPEGPAKWNNFLAEKRSLALQGQLSRVFGDSCKMIEIKASPEDYAALLFMMHEANDPDLTTVSSIIVRNQGNRIAIKRELRNKEKGMLWRRIFSKYFAKIRYARVMLYFEPLTPPAIVQPQEQTDTIEEVIPDTIIPIVVPDTVPTINPTPMPPLVKTDSVVYRRELLSVKTNLPELGAYVPQYGWCPMPNLAIEYYPLHGHFTYGASIDFPWWIGNTTNHKYFELRNYQLEARYYLRSGDIDKCDPADGVAFKGLYLQAYAHAFLYQIGFSAKKGWIGEGVGAGLGLGYVLPLGHKSHWRLEFGAQFGAFITKYDPFVYGCPVDHIDNGLYYYDWTGKAGDFRKRQYNFTWFGPTRLNISLTYDLLYRKTAKSVSFKKKGGAK